MALSLQMPHVGEAYFPPNGPEDPRALMTVEEAVQRVALLLPAGALRNTFRMRSFAGEEVLTGRVASLVNAVGRAGVSAVVRQSALKKCLHLWLGPPGAVLGAWIALWVGGVERRRKLVDYEVTCLRLLDTSGATDARNTVWHCIFQTENTIRNWNFAAVQEAWQHFEEQRARLNVALDQYENELPSTERITNTFRLDRLAALEE